MPLPHPTNSRVALIGCSAYNTLPPLPAVRNNIDALYECIRHKDVSGIASDCISVTVDPEQASDILDPIHRAAEEATDTLLIYFAGHGLIDRRGNLQLAANDPNQASRIPQRPTIGPASTFSTVVHPAGLSSSTAATQAGPLGMMSDPADAIVNEASAEGTFVLAAAGENRTAMAIPGEEYTAFTGELIKILALGYAAAPEFWDLNSIYRHARSSLLARGLPEPHKRDRNAGGDLQIARNQARLKPTTPSKVPSDPKLAQRSGPAGEVGDAANRGRRRVVVESTKYLNADDVKNVAFTKAKTIEEGYPEDEVDAFLDLVAAKFRSLESNKLTSADIHNVSFSAVKPGNRGYSAVEVDAFCDLANQELARREQGSFVSSSGATRHFEDNRWIEYH